MCGYSCTGCGECKGTGKRKSIVPRGLCQHCNTLNGPRAQVCVSCGSKLPPKQELETRSRA